MEKVSPTAFWSIIPIIAASIGGIFFVMMSHASEGKHSESAHEDDVSGLQVHVAQVATKVDHNSRVLEEVKMDLRELRIEQNNANQRILEAIGDR
jgi:hypothetical protein